MPLRTWLDGTSPGWTLADKNTVGLFALYGLQSLVRAVGNNLSIAYSHWNAKFLNDVKVNRSILLPSSEVVASSRTK